MSDLVGNPEDRFSCVAAHMSKPCHFICTAETIAQDLSLASPGRVHGGRGLQMTGALQTKD